MVFLRHKIVKGNSYTYLVENKWNSEKKIPLQKTIKYLGKTSNIILSDIYLSVNKSVSASNVSTATPC